MDSAHYILGSVDRLALGDQETSDQETTPYAEPINRHNLGTLHLL
jgi:hypothetical protein